MYDRKPAIECPLNNIEKFIEEEKSITTVELELMKEYLEKNVDEYIEDGYADVTMKELQKSRKY